MGQAVENGDIPMTEMLLDRLSDEEVAAGNQCSTIARKYSSYLTKEEHKALWDAMVKDERESFAMVEFDSKLIEMQNVVNVAVIALERCESGNTSYPCHEMLHLLRQRNLFPILQNNKN